MQPTESIQLSAEECRKRVLEHQRNAVSYAAMCIANADIALRCSSGDDDARELSRIQIKNREVLQEAKQVLEWLENAINR